jgi:hypothetical protein
MKTANFTDGLILGPLPDGRTGVGSSHSGSLTQRTGYYTKQTTHGGKAHLTVCVPNGAEASLERRVRRGLGLSKLPGIALWAASNTAGLPVGHPAGSPTFRL